MIDLYFLTPNTCPLAIPPYRSIHTTHQPLQQTQKTITTMHTNNKQPNNTIITTLFQVTHSSKRTATELKSKFAGKQFHLDSILCQKGLCPSMNYQYDGEDIWSHNREYGHIQMQG